ncbi:hypothetical protein ACFPRL_32630 [Pseudoclavibacter helvolus]
MTWLARFEPACERLGGGEDGAELSRARVWRQEVSIAVLETPALRLHP